MQSQHLETMGACGSANAEGTSPADAPSPKVSDTTGPGPSNVGTPTGARGQEGACLNRPATGCGCRRKDGSTKRECVTCELMRRGNVGGKEVIVPTEMQVREQIAKDAAGTARIKKERLVPRHMCRAKKCMKRDGMKDAKHLMIGLNGALVLYWRCCSRKNELVPSPQVMTHDFGDGIFKGFVSCVHCSGIKWTCCKHPDPNTEDVSRRKRSVVCGNCRVVTQTAPNGYLPQDADWLVDCRCVCNAFVGKTWGTQSTTEVKLEAKPVASAAAPIPTGSGKYKAIPIGKGRGVRKPALVQRNANAKSKKERSKTNRLTHPHVCSKCHCSYEHEDKLGDKHAEQAFHCPNRDCEWHFKRTKSGKNWTYSRLLKLAEVEVFNPLKVPAKVPEPVEDDRVTDVGGLLVIQTTGIAAPDVKEVSRSIGGLCKVHGNGRRVVLYGVGKYEYTGAVLHAQPKPDWLQEIEEKVQGLLQDRQIDHHPQNFETALLNHYPAAVGIPWHSDNEVEIDQTAPIISYSFGATARFSIRQKFGKTASVFLQEGAVAVMPAGFQADNLHAASGCHGERFSLTWRKYLPDEEVFQDAPENGHVPGGVSEVQCGDTGGAQALAEVGNDGAHGEGVLRTAPDEPEPQCESKSDAVAGQVTLDRVHGDTERAACGVCGLRRCVGTGCAGEDGTSRESGQRLGLEELQRVRGAGRPPHGDEANRVGAWRTSWAWVYGFCCIFFSGLHRTWVCILFACTQIRAGAEYVVGLVRRGRDVCGGGHGSQQQGDPSSQANGVPAEKVRAEGCGDTGGSKSDGKSVAKDAPGVPEKVETGRKGAGKDGDVDAVPLVTKANQLIGPEFDKKLLPKNWMDELRAYLRSECQYNARTHLELRVLSRKALDWINKYDLEAMGIVSPEQFRLAATEVVQEVLIDTASAEKANSAMFDRADVLQSINGFLRRGNAFGCLVPMWMLMIVFFGCWFTTTHYAYTLLNVLWVDLDYVQISKWRRTVITCAAWTFDVLCFVAFGTCLFFSGVVYNAIADCLGGFGRSGFHFRSLLTRMGATYVRRWKLPVYIGKANCSCSYANIAHSQGLSVCPRRVGCEGCYYCRDKIERSWWRRVKESVVGRVDEVSDTRAMMDGQRGFVCEYTDVKVYVNAKREPLGPCAYALERNTASEATIPLSQLKPCFWLDDNQSPMDFVRGRREHDVVVERRCTAYGEEFGPVRKDGKWYQYNPKYIEARYDVEICKPRLEICGVDVAGLFCYEREISLPKVGFFHWMFLVVTCVCCFSWFGLPTASWFVDELYNTYERSKVMSYLGELVGKVDWWAWLEEEGWKGWTEEFLGVRHIHIDSWVQRMTYVQHLYIVVSCMFVALGQVLSLKKALMAVKPIGASN